MSSNDNNTPKTLPPAPLIIAKLVDALRFLERTGRGLENTLAEDLSPLHPEEQQAIMINSRQNHLFALGAARDLLKEIEP